MSDPRFRLKAVSSVLSLAALFALAFPAGLRAEDGVPEPVQKIFKQSCSGCHRGKFPPRGLNLEPANLADMIDKPSQGVADLKIVDSDQPEASYLLKKVRREKGITGKPMPPGKALPPAEVQALEEWVRSLGPWPASAGGMGGPNLGLADPRPAAGASPSKPPFEKPAFWGTRLINLPTTLTPGKGEFLLRISHRFSEPVDAGFGELFGLDSYANILIGLGYGITDNLSFSLGRARFAKEWEFGADWLVAEQGLSGRLPFSIALHAGASLATDGNDSAKVFAVLSLSRQFSKRFSVLVAPALATNTNHWDLDPEPSFALGLGARYMVFEDFSVMAEWAPTLAGYKDLESGWGLGLEKKIGGHVFQIFVTNVFGLTAAQFLPGGDLRIGDLDLRIGFNIFRTF